MAPGTIYLTAHWLLALGWAEGVELPERSTAALLHPERNIPPPCLYGLSLSPSTPREGRQSRNVQPISQRWKLRWDEATRGQTSCGQGVEGSGLKAGIWTLSLLTSTTPRYRAGSHDTSQSTPRPQEHTPGWESCLLGPTPCPKSSGDILQ